MAAALQAAVQSKIDDLGRRLDTYPHYRLTGRSECRLRAGDYRVLRATIPMVGYHKR